MESKRKKDWKTTNTLFSYFLKKNRSNDIKEYGEYVSIYLD